MEVLAVVDADLPSRQFQPVRKRFGSVSGFSRERRGFSRRCWHETQFSQRGGWRRNGGGICVAGKPRSGTGLRLEEGFRWKRLRVSTTGIGIKGGVGRGRLAQDSRLPFPRRRIDDYSARGRGWSARIDGADCRGAWRRPVADRLVRAGLIWRQGGGFRRRLASRFSLGAALRMWGEVDSRDGGERCEQCREPMRKRKAPHAN